MHKVPRLKRRITRASALAIVGALAIGALPSQATAQELVHTFIDPSFGGNPFNAEHLMAIANIHRPSEPKKPEEPPLTEQELIAQQIQSRLLSSLTSNLVFTIQNARPGDSGEFVLGDQIIRYVRTDTETRVTFVNTRTGETSEIVIPVTAARAFAAQGASPEQIIASDLFGGGGSSGDMVTSIQAGQKPAGLSPSAAEIPAGPPPL